MKIKPKDLCYCQSGKKYKDCHMIRDNYKPDKRLIFDKNKYIDEWQKDSNYFFEQGYYNWMANCLFEKINPKMILDIGCGNGNGIIELLKNNNIDNIITIEENEFCIECAYSNIKAKGINVKKIIRNEATFFRGQYINRYSEINDFDISRVTIIQGDILHDEKIKEYIKKQKFDAVTCWLLGTHQSNNDNIDYIEDFIKAGTMDNETFRLLVQNCIYELSDIILNKDAFLHIVDRVGLPCSEERMKICLNNHKGQASVTSLIVDEEIKFLEYEPIGNGIRMKNLLIDDEENATKGMAFISVLSKK